MLILMFWEETITAMMNQTTRNPILEHNLTHGYVQLDRYRRDAGQDSMRDENYFSKASWVFFDAAKNAKYAGEIGTTLDGDGAHELSNMNSYVHSTTYPRIWSPVDRFAKAVLSAVFVDLGLASKPGSSMVSDNDTLSYWSANISFIESQSSIYVDTVDTVAVDYDTEQQWTRTHKGFQNLGILKDSWYSGATISSTYKCQQPQLKPPFNIFISILVADLVFLRTAWTIYNLVVGYFLKSRHPDANICNECLARKKEDEAQAEEKEEPAHDNKSHGFDEHTIELDYLGPPSPDIRRDDQGSAQSLLTHRHV
ncbi:hypothetical protein KCU65_g1411, partial [Aureobasidium melanogenum]